MPVPSAALREGNASQRSEVAGLLSKGPQAAEAGGTWLPRVRERGTRARPRRGADLGLGVALEEHFEGGVDVEHADARVAERVAHVALVHRHLAPQRQHGLRRVLGDGRHLQLRWGASPGGGSSTR